MIEHAASLFLLVDIGVQDVSGAVDSGAEP
jgi:hypothetical protein